MTPRHRPDKIHLCEKSGLLAGLLLKDLFKRFIRMFAAVAVCRSREPSPKAGWPEQLPELL